MDIHIGEEILPLYRVREENNLWYCSVTLPRDSWIKHDLKYNYSLHLSGCDFTSLNERMRIQPHYCEEICQRIVRRVKFDVFYFPDNRHREGETISTSIIWYLKWFLQFVEDSTISQILIHIEGFNFQSLTTDHVNELVDWIGEQALGNSITEIQRLYLCMVLNLVEFRRNLKTSYLNGKKVVCDRFLQCFTTAVHSNFLSKSALKHLEKIAIILVENSSSAGWLTLAAHFYPYLGIKFLLDNKDAKRLDCTYNSEEYRKLVTALFSSLKVENQDERKELLSLVLKSAPTLVTAFGIFKFREMSAFFATENESDEFFVEFCKEALKTNENKNGLRAKLLETLKLMAKISKKLPEPVYSALFEYAKSGEELQAPDIQDLVKLILSIKDLGMDQFVKILMELSTSELITHHQDLLFQILDNELFKEGWLEIPFEKKVDICNSWVITRVITRVMNGFRQKALKTNENIKDLRKKLSEISKLPTKILRKKLQGLVSSILSEYAKSNEELQAEDIQGLVELILSIKSLGMDQFVNILIMVFSTSKSFARQNLLLRILDNELFKKSWLEIPLFQKMDICNSWVITRVMNIMRVSSLEGLEKVMAVYESIEAIARRSSSVPVDDRTLLHEVSIRVAEKVFEAEDAISVLQAYGSVEKLSPEVQECYITHVKKILTPDLIQKSSYLVKKFLGSRYVLLTLLSTI